MNGKNNSINVSIVGGWGSHDFDVASGVVSAGGKILQVPEVACNGCAHPFKVGDTVAIVKFDDPFKKERAYHTHCLPDEFGFAFRSFVEAIFH